MNHPSPDLPHDAATHTPPTAAGFDVQCLRQALHDLRGPLNNATILLQIVKTLGNADPDAARGKVVQAVAELHRIGRMLDQLTIANDGATAEPRELALAALLGAAAAAVPAATRVTVEAGTGAPFVNTDPVWAPAEYLERALRLVFERCAATLPDGGTVRVDRSDLPATTRLTFTANGPRVERPSNSRPRLTDGARAADDWFPCWALVRRVRGDLHVDHGNDVGIRIAIELPRPASPRS